MTTDEVVAVASAEIDPFVPRFAKLPARKTTPKGADLVWWPLRRVLRLATDKRTNRDYRVRELAVDRAAFHGRAFTLDKLTAGTDAEATDYTCLVSDLGEGHHSCECKGHLRHGHCAHLDALLAIIANGWDRIPHPCATAEYDAFTQAVDAGAPDPVPAVDECPDCGGRSSSRAGAAGAAPRRGWPRRPGRRSPSTTTCPSASATWAAARGTMCRSDPGADGPHLYLSHYQEK